MRALLFLGAFCLSGQAMAQSPCSPDPTASRPPCTENRTIPADALNRATGIGNACANIMFYGAVADGVTDNSAAWSAALAQSTGHPCIYFPAGTYAFASGISATLSTNGQVLSIYGDGPDTTTLSWAGGGGLTIIETAAQVAIHVRDLALLTGAVNTGIALNVEHGAFHNNNIASNTVDRVRVSGTTIGANYWAIGIKFNGVSQVNFNSLDLWGQTIGGGAGSRGIGLDLEAPPTNLSFIYNITNSNFFGGQNGLKYGSNVQGVTVANCNFTLNYIGIYVPTGSINQAQLSVSNSQFDNGGDNILFDTGTTLSHVQIDNNLFFLVANTAGIHFKGLGQYAMLRGNEFITTSAALITAQGIAIDANPVGQNIASDNLCVLLSNCITLGFHSNNWRVSNTRVDRVTAPVTNTGSNNIITGFINPTHFATTYPQGFAVTGVADNGSGAIRLALSDSPGLINGEIVMVLGIDGVATANGLFAITVIDGTHVDLVHSAFAGSYTSGGTLWVMP
jgi:Pectate lyase superfamily protein